MILNLFKPCSLFHRLFHFFLLLVGLSIGVFSSLCLKTFVFTFQTHLLPLPVQQTVLSAPPPPVQEAVVAPVLNGVSNNTSINVSNSSSLLLSMIPNNAGGDDELYSTKAIPPPQSPPSNGMSNNTNVIVSDLISLGSPPMHNMSDDELLSTASSKVSSDFIQDFADVKKQIQKVAFMFLTPGPLPLAPFWDKFFRGYEGKYSIYIHPHPSSNESAPQDSVFHRRKIPSQEVRWGTISMIDAERRLVANALLDPSNQRFVLLSDSCIPLFNFSTIYNYLMGSNYSFLASFDDPRKPGRGRYNRRMWPTITIQQWRKGSQWFEIHRDLAVKVISDTKYHRVFQDFCLPPCYTDEHYFPTLVNILDLEMMNSNRTVTRVDWSRGGSHPRRFGWIDVKIELIIQLRFEPDCTYNGQTTDICYLFARKFLPNTLGPLLRIAPLILGYDS